MAITLVLAEDSFLLREGISALLALDEELELLAGCAPNDELMAAVEERRPQVVITDIRMPPAQTDEGIRAIGSLTPSDIQRCINDWTQTLAPRSVRRVYQTLAAVLNAAVLNDRIARSPCRGIRLPAVQPI